MPYLHNFPMYESSNVFAQKTDHIEVCIAGGGSALNVEKRPIPYNCIQVMPQSG